MILWACLLHVIRRSSVRTEVKVCPWCQLARALMHSWANNPRESVCPKLLFLNDSCICSSVTRLVMELMLGSRR